VTVNATRTRERHLKDWIETSPGWWVHVKTATPSGVVTFNQTEKSDWAKLLGNSPGPRGREITSDENHISQLKSFHSFQFEGDIGGEFSSTKSGIRCDSTISECHDERFDVSGNKITSDYIGPLVPSAIAWPSTGVPLPSNIGLDDLAPIGTTAIARCKPTNNVANLATDLVETRQQGLPHLQGAALWEEKTLTAKAAGSEYLNQEFGWNPLVSDIRGASYAAANAGKILSSYERNSHKITRRRYEFPVETSSAWDTVATNTALVSPHQLNYNGAQNTPRGNVYRNRQTFRRRWFSGAFTYHLPLGFNSRNRLIRDASRAGPLLGIELTPEVIWNATPWTWALDWFSNVGDCVSIYSDMAVDGLVIKYGYIMEHTLSTNTYYFVQTSPGINSWRVARSPVFESFIETKRRKRATPFGFAIGWSGMSFRQLAITAALGLTRW